MDDLASVPSGTPTEKWPEWLFEYDYEGATYCFAIPAPTAQDATQRVRKLSLYGRLQGEVCARIPVPDGAAKPMSWLLSAWCWLKNR